ncbi:MAG: CbtB-domain containing protein [Defluviicoccus sp.]|nr:CbtB-domain containing protein [Defluviicoccus sp.]MDE0386403.1 CbtB-domain containing protein [Defluviicoccus sp.]
MTAQTQSRVLGSTNLAAIALCAFIGLAIVTLAGHVQTSALHDAAHDTRHAAGFPCH